MSGINKLNKMYVRLYERNGDGTLAASNVVSVESLLGAGNDSLTATYNLRVEVIGNRIKCFLNDVVAFDTGDDTFATGAFGVRAFHQVGSVDNFAVTEIDQFSQGQLPGGSTSSGTGSTPTYTYPEGVYYQDDFSTADFVNKGWNRDLTVVNGQVEMYSFAGAYLTNRADMKNLTDYTVEAWVTMDDLLPSSTTGKFAGVVARATGSGKGYEFGLYYSNGLKYRLYDRTSGDQLAAGALDFLYGVSYRIRLVVNGNRIMGFVDDRLVADCKHEGNPVGTAGVRQLGYAAYYDNYVVRESTEDEKKGIGAVYTAPKADKNGIYFSDNFNTKASVAGGVWGSILQIKNSQALVPVQGVVTLGGNPGFALLEDYVVQADVTLDVTTELDGGYGHAAIVARGYEFAIFSQSNGEDSYLRLYDRENGKILAKNDEFKIEPGKAYTMTLMVEGNRICAFLDGKLVIDLKDDAHKNGTIGARGMHMEFAMDNFVVRKVTAADRKGTPNVTVPNTGDTLVYVYVSLAIFLAAAIVLLLTKRRAILH